MTTETQQASTEQSSQPSTEGENFTAQDVTDSFTAGFGSEEAPSAKAPAASSPTKKEETPAAKKDDEGSTPKSASAPSTERKFAGFNEEEMKQILSAVPENSRQYQELSKQMRQINGWIGSIKDRLDKIGGSASSATPAASASAPRKESNSEAMKKLREDLPDVAAVIEDALANISATPGGPSKEELEQIVQGRVADAISGFRTEDTKRQHRAILRTHPDLQEALAKARQANPQSQPTLGELMGQDFKVWLAAQSAAFQKEVNDADDASTVSDAYSKFKDWKKAQTTQSEDERKRQDEQRRKDDEERARKERQQGRLAQAVTPSGVPSAGPSTQSAEAAFLEGFGQT